MDGAITLAVLAVVISLALLGNMMGKETANDAWVSDCTYLKSHVYVMKDGSKKVFVCEEKP
jgi:hypothetical protein